MFAQVIKLAVKPDKLEEFCQLYRDYINPEVKGQKGYIDFCLLVDRVAGRCLSVTIWEDRDKALASEEKNLYLEQRAAYPFYAAPPVREEYEVGFKG